MKKIMVQGLMLGLLVISGFISSFIAKMIEKNHTFWNSVGLLFNGDSGPFLTYFFSFLITSLVILIGFYFLLKKFNLADSFFNFGTEQLGTSKMAKTNEFKGVTGKDGLPISKNFRLSAQNSFTHYLLIGPTGSGKSSSFYVNALLDLPKDSSVIVTDPKGELFQKTAQHALDMGKDVMVFSPFHSKSMGYNPLALCRNTTEIRELAQVLLANGNAAIEQLTGTKAGGSEWTNMATPLLVCWLIFVRNLDAPDNTVHKALEIITENDLETMKLLMEDAESEAQQQFNIFLQSADSEKTAASIKTVLATNLQMFTDPLIQRITSHNEIDPKALRKRPTHLYVIVPEVKSSFMSPLMSPFYSQIMNSLLESGEGYPVYILFDEFANIGIIPGISTVLATIRSRRVSISLGIQSVNQLKQKYNEEANSILDNLKTKAFLPGLSYDSAEYASKMIGFKEIETTSTSFGKSQDVSYSVSKQKRELMTPDEVRRLPDNTILVITDNRNPFVDKQNRYYEDKRLLALSKKELTVEEFLEE